MKHIIDINARNVTLRGPAGISVCLDASEIYIDDPGQGCPVMVFFQRGSQRESMSWGCAYEGGNWQDAVAAAFDSAHVDPSRETDEKIQAYADTHQRWLEEVSEDVSEWERTHYQIAKGSV
jgi:hypothetical protein